MESCLAHDNIRINPAIVFSLKYLLLIVYLSIPQSWGVTMLEMRG